eukprot:6484236-Amphidinium_carterae.1
MGHFVDASRPSRSCSMANPSRLAWLFNNRELKPKDKLCDVSVQSYTATGGGVLEAQGFNISGRTKHLISSQNVSRLLAVVVLELIFVLVLQIKSARQTSCVNICIQ